MGKKLLSVIAPVYNEEGVIALFHKELSAVLDSLKPAYDSEIIFVVDRCSDRTPEILRDIAANNPTTKAIFMSARFGHQAALKAGIDFAQGDAVLMMDSDLQHPPQVIPEMIKLFEAGYDVVYGIRETSQDVGLFRKKIGKLFYRAVSSLADIDIPENAPDFRLVSRKVADVFKFSLNEKNQFLRGLYSWVGFRSVGVRFRAAERAAGKTKYSLATLIRFSVHGLLSFSKKPLQLAIFAGTLISLLSFFSALYFTAEYFVNRNLPNGWTTLAVLITFLAGIQLLVAGILGAYIGGIFDEVKMRPHYIVDYSLNTSMKA